MYLVDQKLNFYRYYLITTDVTPQIFVRHSIFVQGIVEPFHECACYSYLNYILKKIFLTKYT